MDMVKWCREYTHVHINKWQCGEMVLQKTLSSDYGEMAKQIWCNGTDIKMVK